MTSKVSRKLEVQYGDERLEFEVVPSRSRTSSVRISVDSPDGIQVSAPASASDAEIRSAVRRKAKWIWKYHGSQRSDAKRQRVISGGEILYLGRRYVLKVMCGATDSVKLKSGKLVVQTRERESDAIKLAVDGWYRQRAKEYFARRISVLFSPTLDKNASLAGFGLRTMRRQWGSCSPAGKILLNPLLIRAPRTCVDYVIVHELCHLKHHDHNLGFYHLLNARMPDWKERKAFLELIADQILDQ